MNATSPNALLTALAAATAAAPHARKLLVCRRSGVGREVLRALALSGRSWLGWETSTPARLAHELAAPLLAERGLALTDEFEELALVDDALAAVVAASTEGLALLADRVGLRQAVTASVRALRLSGVTAAQLGAVKLRDEVKGAQLTAILAHYEAALAKTSRVDAAVLYALALEAVRGGGVVAAEIRLMPDVRARGLERALLDALCERGAMVLPEDAVQGLERPASWPDPVPAETTSPLSWLYQPGGASGAAAAVDVFAASTAQAELREVLRRIVAAGLRWDDVEIIATDPVEYGVALDELARGLGIPVSFGAGLPLARTRTGRAVQQYLGWLESDFDAALLRGMLERGDVVKPGDGAGGMTLARRLRTLRIGRGRARYADALARRQEAAAERPDELAQLAELGTLMEALLAPVPDLAAPLEPAQLAEAVLQLLRHVPVGSVTEATARERVLTHMERVRATLHRPVSLDAALAIVRRVLDERVPPPGAEGPAPWRAAGGHLHLSDLNHGGATARRATFVVGVDAARFPGTGGIDPLLVDEDRMRVNAAVPGAQLATAAERLQERRFALAQLLAKLRGRVTLSYATWDAVDGRTIAPAAEVLQAHRLRSGDSAADYEKLREAVSPIAGAVPRTTMIDASDVWLQLLAGGDVPRRGVKQVCAVYTNLGAGAQAYQAWLERRAEPDAVHGAVLPRSTHDPRRSLNVVSATQLQTLGTCPHRYMLRYVLGVRPPEDVQLSPEMWLTPGERGALLHAVYENALAAAQSGELDVREDTFEQHALQVLEQFADAARAVTPPPGERVHALECEALAADVRAFVAMVRADAPRILALEHRFGRDGAEPVTITLPDGTPLSVAGAIDRVDEVEGGLAVVDYKTGSAARFGARHGVFDGGRRLQHALYAAVAERVFGQRVVQVEYLFPTERSANQRVKFTREEMRDGGAIVLELLGLLAQGTFVPTTDPGDCRVCDYRAVCRVRDLDYGKTKSPPAEWAQEAAGAAVETLRRLRR